MGIVVSIVGSHCYGPGFIAFALVEPRITITVITQSCVYVHTMGHALKAL